MRSIVELTFIILIKMYTTHLNTCLIHKAYKD